MIEFSALAVGMIAGVFAILIYRHIRLMRKFAKCEFMQFVDTAGITQNPPAFVDLWTGQTINFKLGDEDIKITQFRPAWGFKYIRRIAFLFKALQAEIETEHKKALDEWRGHARYTIIYMQIVGLIYNLSKYHVKSRRRFKRELRARAKQDVMYIMDICEQVLDFWVYVKKKASLLASETTLRQTTGEAWQDNSCELDGNGTIYAKPRYGLSSNMVH